MFLTVSSWHALCTPPRLNNVPECSVLSSHEDDPLGLFSFSFLSMLGRGGATIGSHDVKLLVSSAAGDDVCRAVRARQRQDHYLKVWAALYSFQNQLKCTPVWHCCCEHEHNDRRLWLNCVLKAPSNGHSSTHSHWKHTLQHSYTFIRSTNTHTHTTHLKTAIHKHNTHTLTKIDRHMTTITNLSSLARCSSCCWSIDYSGRRVTDCVADGQQHHPLKSCKSSPKTFGDLKYVVEARSADFPGGTPSTQPVSH